MKSFVHRGGFYDAEKIFTIRAQSFGNFENAKNL